MSLLKNLKINLKFCKESLKTVITDYRELHTLPGKSKFTQTSALELPINCEYFVSTEKGVYRLTSKNMVKVFNLWTMGIAVNNTHIFLACTNSKRTYILKGKLEAFLYHKISYGFEELYSQNISSSSQRIHQICIDDNCLWVANTPRNTLLQIDANSGAKICEIAPFHDSFGMPILYDNNHINSVFMCGECLLFVAYRAGEQSMIGIYYDGRIIGFRYENIGVHDIFISGSDVLISDTFGEKSAVDSGGILIVNGQPFDKVFFDTPPGFIVRGLAGDENEILIGHSHKGVRSNRFKGNGSLLVSKNGKVTHNAVMPFAQTYDIIHTTGESFKQPPDVKTFEEICAKLHDCFGSPVYQSEARFLDH